MGTITVYLLNYVGKVLTVKTAGLTADDELTVHVEILFTCKILSAAVVPLFLTGH